VKISSEYDIWSFNLHNDRLNMQICVKSIKFHSIRGIQFYITNDT